jgi:hypothetical protein
VTVTRCLDCPFYRASILTMMLDSVRGFCSYDMVTDSMSGWEPPPEGEQARLRRRLPILDPTTVPEACPLRVKSVMVAISKGN